MNKSRASGYHQKRSSITIEYIKQASEELIQSETLITAASVSKKIDSYFNDNGIDRKYQIGEESIGRSTKYNTILKFYKNKQSLIPDNKKLFPIADDFELRDKLDMLQQDYIELLDKNRWLGQQAIQDKETIDELSKQQYHTSNTSTNNNSIRQHEVLSFINKILEENSVSIIKQEEKQLIIIKSVMNSSQERVEISFKDWNDLL